MNERYQKQYISGASGGFFQVVEVVQKHIYFKFVISASQSHSKCPEVKMPRAVVSLLSVLRTGKPNWRGVQLFRRTNRKMIMCNCSLLSLCNLCRSISPVIRLPLEDNCNRTFLIFSIFSFLNLNILHTKN